MIKFNFKLSQGGRGIRRAAQRIADRNRVAAMRATNTTGRKVRTQVKRATADLLNIPQKLLRSREIPASRRRIAYEYRLYRREYQPRILKGTRFRPHKGQRRGADKSVGVLRMRAYGKQQTFDPVMRVRTPRGDRYLLLHGHHRRPTRVMGTWLKADYRAAAALKKTIGPKWRIEYRRQIKLLLGRP